MVKVVYEWFLQYQDRVNITGELLLEKARDTMKLLHLQQDSEYNFSQGWLEKFNLRHEIKSFCHFGESGSVDIDDMEKKLESIRKKLDQFHMKDVFNIDKTSMFYRLQAEHSHATKQLEGRKQDKERLTIVICCNEDGSEKIPLWIIGKYAKPRCFKNVNMNNLNCQYGANKRAWMTSALFDEYIRCFANCTAKIKMNFCSSSKHSPEDDQIYAAKNPASFSLILPLSSPSFNFIHSSPFFRQPFNLNPDVPLLMETSNVVREVQNYVVSSVDKCLKMLDNLRSQNEVLDRIMSFPSYLQNGYQIQRRNCRNSVMLSNPNFAAILPGDSVAGVVVANGILNFLNIYNTLLVARLVLTWFPNAPPAIVSPLSTICDPYLNIFRGIIPPLGGLDLSPILAFLVLNAFTSTASALPAELPSEGSKDIPSHTTSSQKKWMRRLCGDQSKRSNGEI
ncbi:hypothetical protein BUALT_Bualt10G0134100 [Buddleja alternifolia]|uniref:HTH CENPB-type domain-containing protein n=1 Tax=Buddleja alternifolia TaxID=168488 RepID=A0AAV6WZL6_9LAMI|nr:hypothetical protein BUALT_Bualt10G0134100 [Buddleja alternifolia]